MLSCAVIVHFCLVFPTGNEGSHLKMELFWILFFSVLHRYVQTQGVYGKDFTEKMRLYNVTVRICVQLG